MNLDEAIQHCEEVANANERLCETVHPAMQLSDYGKCAEEHRQLAEWLKELKDYRKTWDEVQKEIYRQIDALDEIHEFRDKEAYYKALDIVNKYLKEVEHDKE